MAAERRDLAGTVKRFWSDTVRQDGNAMEGYFTKDALIRWHNTNEQFDVSEYIRANCQYPGSWEGEIERLEAVQTGVVTVTRVWSVEESISFHATSFFEFREGKISSLDEYWGDDGPAPGWRLELKIGKPLD